MRRQKGFFSILSILLILVIGLMGGLIAYLFSHRAMLRVYQVNGLRAFYIAESGLDIGARLVTNPTLANRLTCAELSASPLVTNASLGAGNFTLTGTPNYGVSTLSSALTASANVIPVASTAGFTSSGKIFIDKEAIDYGGISGNSFVGLTRGTNGTLASTHIAGTRVVQYVCQVGASAGIPSLTSPQVRRQLQWNIQLLDGWAVGNTLSSPTRWNLTHWNLPNEQAWTQVNSSAGSISILQDVSIISSVDAWAVGSAGTALHYNGSTWTAADGGLPNDIIYGVSAVSSREVFCCTSGGDVYRWTGGNWARVYNGNRNLQAISVLDTNGTGTADVGWAVGLNDTAIYYNGSTWTSVNNGINENLYGVSVVSATDAWASGRSGDVYRWTGGNTWATVATPSSSPTLNSISMMESNGVDIGWTVGTSSTAWFFNGSSWVNSNSGLPSGLTINSVFTVSANEAWLVASNGQIYAWNGTTWTLTNTAAAGLNSIRMVRMKGQRTSAWQQIFA